MLADQLLRMPGLLLQGSADGLGLRRIGHAQRIAQRHRQIAQPAQMTDTANRAAFGAAQESGFVPLPELQQLCAAQTMAFIKIR